MSRKIWIGCVIIGALLLSACSGVVFNGNRTGNSSQLLMDYSVLNRSDSQIFELEKGDVVQFEIVSKSGKLDVSLSLEGGKSVYEGKNVPTGSFTVTVNKSGKYKCEVVGHKAQGSVKIEKEGH